MISRRGSQPTRKRRRAILNSMEPLPALGARSQATPDARFGTCLRHPRCMPGNSEQGDRGGSQQSLPLSAFRPRPRHERTADRRDICYFAESYHGPRRAGRSAPSDPPKRRSATRVEHVTAARLSKGLHSIQGLCIPAEHSGVAIIKGFAMAAFADSILGGFIVAALAFITTRYTLLYSYDQTLRDRRLERYQELFRLTRHFHRYYLIGEEPTRRDLEEYRKEFDAWYFSEAAGGMFLTKATKDIYMQMMNIIAEAAFENGRPRENSPLTPAN
jgi:hypothetical protein